MNKQKLTDAITALETAAQLHKDSVSYAQRTTEQITKAAKLITEALIPEKTNYEVQVNQAKHHLVTDDGLKLFITDDSYREYIVGLAKEEVANASNKTIYVNFNHKEEDIVKREVKGFERITHAILDEEFHVNKEKRTVVCLLRGYKTRYVYAKGIAKCDPNDTFNEHLGKVIALYRATGEILPEIFLTVPNPEKIKNGDILKFSNGESYSIDNIEIEGTTTKADYVNLRTNGNCPDIRYTSPLENSFEIIDDSNRK